VRKQEIWANAHKQFLSAVILIYLHPFRSNSLTAKSAKNTYFWRSRSSMLTFLRSSSPLLVMISSTSVPIWNHFHVTEANSENNHFFEGYPSLTPECVGLVEPRGSRHGLLKSTFNAENFICRLSSLSHKHLHISSNYHSVCAPNCQWNLKCLSRYSMQLHKNKQINSQTAQRW